MSFPNDSIMAYVKSLEMQLNTLRDNLIYAPPTNDLSAVFGTLGSRNAAHGVQTGLQADQPLDHLITDVDNAGMSTGVFDRINIMSANVVVDRSGFTALNLKTIQKTVNNGQKITALTVKSGKTLTLKTGGNLAIASDIAMTDQDIAYLVYSENISNKYRVLITGASGSSVAFPILPPIKEWGDVSGTVAVDLSLTTAHLQEMRLTGNITLTFNNPPVSTKQIQFELDIKQDGTGGRTVTFPGTVNPPTPTINSAANTRTIILCQSNDGGVSYDCFNATGDFANRTLSNLTSPTAVNQDLHMSGNSIDGLGSDAITGNVSTNYFIQDTAGWIYNVATGDTHVFTINSTLALQIEPSRLVTSPSTNFLLHDTAGWIYNCATGDTHTWTINEIAEMQLSDGKLNILAGNSLVFDAGGAVTAANFEIERIGGAMVYNVPTANTHNFAINGSTEVVVEPSKLTLQPATNFLLHDTAGIIYNVGTGDSHIFTINTVGHLEILPGKLNLIANGTITAGNYEITRVSGGLVINVPTSNAIAFDVNGVQIFKTVATQNESLKPMVFYDQASYSNPASTTSMILARSTDGMSETWTVNDFGFLDPLSSRSKWRHRRPLQIVPHTKTIADIEGIWPVTLTVTMGLTWNENLDTTNGASRAMQIAVSGLNTGIHSASFAEVVRQQNPDITIKFQSTVSTLRRIWIGWFSSDPMGSGTQTQNHFGLRLDSSAGSTQFGISHADGTTQAVTDLGAANTSVHTIRLIADQTNSRWGYSFDGAAITWITTNIPGSTTQLGFNCRLRALESATKELRYWWTEGSIDT